MAGGADSPSSSLSPRIKIKTPSQTSPADSIHSRPKSSPFTSRNSKNASVRIRRGSTSAGAGGKNNNQRSSSNNNNTNNPNQSNRRGDQAPDGLLSQVRMLELSVRRQELNQRHRERVLAEREEAKNQSDSDEDDPEEMAVTPGTVSTSDPLDPAEMKLKARNEALAKEKKAEKATLLMEREISGVENPKGKKRAKISDLLHPHHHHHHSHNSDDSSDEENKTNPRNEKAVGFSFSAGLETKDKRSKKKRHAKMPKWRKSRSRPGVMETLGSQNQKALDLRDEDRKATRAARFQELDQVNGVDQDLERQGQGQDHQSDQEFENDEIVDTLEVVDPGVSAVTTLSNIANSIIFPPIPGLYSRAPIIDLPIAEEGSRTSSESNLAESNYSTGQNTDLEGQELHAPPALTKSKTELAEIAPAPKNLDEHVKEVLRKRDMVKRGLKGVWSFVKTPLGIITAIYGFLVVFFGAGLVLFLLGWVDHGKNKDFWVEVFSQGINALFTITGVGLIPWRLRDTYWMARICHYQHLTWRLRRERGLPKLRDCNDLPEAGVTGITTGAAVRREDAEKGILTPADEKLRQQYEMREKKNSSSKDDEEEKDSSPSGSSKSKSEANRVSREEDVLEKETKEGESEKKLGEEVVEDDDDSSSIGSGSAAPSSVLRAGQDDRLRLPPDYDEEQVLTPRQADELHRLQKLFAQSNSFYRPHETPTHRAFPISWALGVTLLNDGNSLFQVLLCISMWYFAPQYQNRPAWQTACGIVFSFSCGIGSGVLIWRGGERTKKRDEVEKRLKKAFEEEERLDKVEKELFEKRWLELMQRKENGEAVSEEEHLVAAAAESSNIGSDDKASASSTSEAQALVQNFKQEQTQLEKEEQKDQDAALTNLMGLGGIGKARD